ncbi:uncharacterized protein EDB93DRAFT_1256215 [Suillus bovinus]|uniref:uncharacterized protein n=1 Tax=Suillus bovinus TaxID=48563 RepID=UPI001B86EE4A|nr:uncharacterized protein EDB93DRAFT_1256215 [Suillus bovinus]KAG2129548.1 hypothetical protein EDB93DRAFT_1256215 [Suillus bovinus]
MKLSLVFSVLASVIVLATAYPTMQGAGIVKRSSVEQRDELNAEDRKYYGYGKRDEEKFDNIAKRSSVEQREELNAEDRPASPQSHPQETSLYIYILT